MFIFLSALSSKPTCIAEYPSFSTVFFWTTIFGFAVITVTGTNKYVFYTYPASYGDLSSITISGLESIGAFTKTVGNVTNAQGFAVSYNIYTSNNQFTNTTISFNSVN